LDLLNRYAMNGEPPKIGDANREDFLDWIDTCGRLLSARVLEERSRKYSRNAGYATAIQGIVEECETEQELANALRAYRKTLAPAERHQVALFTNLIEALFATEPDLAIAEIRKTREHQRLWRARLNEPVPEVAIEVNRQRLASAPSPGVRKRALVAGIRLPEYRPVEETAAVSTLQEQLATIWKKAIRRCEYPDCDVPGGRFYSGRAKECPPCRSRHGRVTGFRHRRERRGFLVQLDLGAGMPVRRRTSGR
jgi:hypothetical protein